jgi:hypothetical protein
MGMAATLNGASGRRAAGGHKEGSMDISFTAYLWLNWTILFLTAGAFWTLGAWIVATLLGAIRRGPAA